MSKLNLSFLKNLKKMDRNSILIAVAVVGIVITGALIFVSSNQKFSFPAIFGNSNDRIAKAAVDFINNSGLSSTPASLVSFSEESGLVKVKIKIGTSEFDSYATKDGKLLFPQAFEMKKADASANQNANAQTAEQAAASIQKSDSPMLEAYVVSMCPYGVQMQRAMADAVNRVPELAKYIKAVYIGSVSSSGKTIDAMHGAEEAAENLRQICIRDEQSNKYWSYISCYIKAGNASSCEASTGVDSAKLNACVTTPSRGVAFAKKDFDLNTKYNVSGSPTLVLNGAIASESSFGGRSSEGVKAMVCAAFNNQPSFCSTKLNTVEAAASFSETYEGSGSQNASANCGS